MVWREEDRREEGRGIDQNPVSREGKGQGGQGGGEGGTEAD